MNKTSYEIIKGFINNKLRAVNGVLPRNKINEEIENIKDSINKVGLDIFAKILSIEESEKLSEDDWCQMARELETYYNVRMENGILIQGEEQQNRDNVWWTSKEKQRCDNYYWERYKSYISQYSEKPFPPEVVKVIDVDTDRIMDNIGDPAVDNFSRYGMVVGHVQSGKTANYSALICKAADAGYKFIVVVAGGINNLRNQTQERINEAFVGKDKEIFVGVGNLPDLKLELLPVSLTTKEQDFNKRDANKNSQGLNFDNIRSPIILVIKKNTSTLTNVINWLEAQYKNQIANHAMLLIDDESDYASINTKEEEDPTAINKKIRTILNLFRKSVYVAYTATPYANIFIDHKAENDSIGKDLFPKDFIYSLAAPDNYFGARKIFLDTDRKHLIEINDYADIIPSNHKKDFSLPAIPDSLYEAIRLFIINIAIRSLRNQKNKHNSMLIHATRFTMVHQKLSIHVENYLNKVKMEINVLGALDDAHMHSEIINDLKETYKKIYPNIEFEWKLALKSLCGIIDSVVVREVHQSSKIPLVYRKDVATNAIVVGGTSLSRGYTLEGLSVSYFLRNTVFYDTLMQMGRWFGYRPGYEDLCYIYMTETMIKNFSLIIEATEDLFDNFKRMEERNMTPEDFGLAVRQHPDSGLQVTARNKQKNSEDYYFEMKLDGHLKETSWLDNNQKVKENNLNVILDTIKKLYSVNDSPIQIKVKNKVNYLWKNIDKTIAVDFLEKFKAYSSDLFGLKSRMPIDFVKKYVMDIDTKWDIALYSGWGQPYNVSDIIKIRKEKRKVEDKGTYYEIKNRQVSSGNSEAIALPEILRKELGSKRKDIREKLERPLLMLHILETDEDKELAAFGISFPGGVESGNKNIKLKINSVFIQELQEQLYEEEFDD